MSPRGQFLFGFLGGKATDSLSWISWCPSWSRTIKHTGKCSLFVYLRGVCPRFTWMPWVSIFELLVCQLGGSSPCVHQTWYLRSKDHCHLEWNCTLGINCDLGVPTKISQHPCDTFLASLGGHNIALSQRTGLSALGCGSSWLPLKWLIRWFDRAGEYLFPGQKFLHACKGICWWQWNRSLTHHVLDAAGTNSVISWFSCIGLCTWTEWTYPIVSTYN